MFKHELSSFFFFFKLSSFCDLTSISMPQGILVIRPTPWAHQVRGNERCPRPPVTCKGGRWGFRTSTCGDRTGSQKGTLIPAMV